MPNVIFFIYDGSDAGRDYRAGDIVDIQDGVRLQNGVEVIRQPFLPPAAPFWLVRVWGVTKAECQFLMDVDYNGESLRTKRLWQIRNQNVPAAVRNYFAAHRFAGFGDPVDVAFYGATVAGDSVIQWADARTWMYNKNAHITA
jgi:hypothetical protein